MNLMSSSFLIFFLFSSLIIVGEAISNKEKYEEDINPTFIQLLKLFVWAYSLCILILSLKA